MKSIIRRYIYWFKELLFWSIMGFGLLITLFYLDSQLQIPLAVTIIIGLFLLAIIIYIDLVLHGNLYNPLCTYKVKGKIIDYINQYEGNETPLLDNYSYIITVEYTYKNKTYRKIMKIPEYYRNGYTIKICRFFPKMVHIDFKKDDK